MVDILETWDGSLKLRVHVRIYVYVSVCALSVSMCAFWCVRVVGFLHPN